MKCGEIKKLLSGYLDGELTDRERGLLEEHLRVCAGCAEELRGLRECVEKLGSLEEVKPPADFLSQVHVRLEEKSDWKAALGKVFSPLRLRIPLEVAAAAAVVILVVYLLNIPPGNRSVRAPAVPPSLGRLAKAARADWEAGLKEADFYAREEKAEAVGRLKAAAPHSPVDSYALEQPAPGAAVSDEAAVLNEGAVELVLLVEPETGYPKERVGALARKKTSPSRALEGASLGEEREEPRFSRPLTRLEALIDREGGEIVSTEERADLTRRMVIKLPPNHFRSFRESLSRISDLPPAGPDRLGEGPETFRFRLLPE